MAPQVVRVDEYTTINWLDLRDWFTVADWTK